MNHYLSLILFTPLLGALVVSLVNKRNENAIRWIANIFADVPPRRVKPPQGLEILRA